MDGDANVTIDVALFRWPKACHWSTIAWMRPSLIAFANALW